MSILKQTQLKTAVSELLTNALKYAGAASVTIELTGIMERRGIRVTVTDNGPGIKDIPLALTPGYSTKGTLGLGLPGAQRLVDQFTIESAPNAGTMVKVTKWA